MPHLVIGHLSPIVMAAVSSILLYVTVVYILVFLQKDIIDYRNISRIGS